MSFCRVLSLRQYLPCEAHWPLASSGTGCLKWCQWLEVLAQGSGLAQTHGHSPPWLLGWGIALHFRRYCSAGAWCHALPSPSAHTWPGGWRTDCQSHNSMGLPPSGQLFGEFSDSRTGRHLLTSTRCPHWPFSLWWSHCWTWIFWIASLAHLSTAVALMKYYIVAQWDNLWYVSEGTSHWRCMNAGHWD